MSVPVDIVRDNPGIGDWSILHAWRGSVAHGMWEPSSNPNSIDDKDTVSVCVPPIENYFGLKEFGSRGTQEIMLGEWDIVVYEARKAIKMLRQGNPNILSLLWLPENGYISKTHAGEMLLHHRKLFAGRWVYQPFVGYAKAQFHKMEHGSTQGYMGEKRKTLVEKYGYDTKNAAHLIRLLRMGVEFLNTGTLQVDRGGFDATELLDIKHGKWPLERIKSEANGLFKRAEGAYDRCSLPAVPDVAAINILCRNMVGETLAERGELT